jgi:hypothetical protein
MYPKETIGSTFYLISPPLAIEELKSQFYNSLLSLSFTVKLHLIDFGINFAL